MAPAQSKKAKNCLSQTEGQKQKPKARQFPKPKTKNRTKEASFFRQGGRGENKFLILASLFLSPPRRRKARILKYVSRSPTQAAAKRGRQNGKLFSTCPQGVILAGVGTAGAFSLLTFFWRQKKVTTLQQPASGEKKVEASRNG
jgi:hypothetical protein